MSATMSSLSLGYCDLRIPSPAHMGDGLRTELAVAAPAEGLAGLYVQCHRGQRRQQPGTRCSVAAAAAAAGPKSTMPVVSTPRAAEQEREDEGRERKEKREKKDLEQQRGSRVGVPAAAVVRDAGQGELHESGNGAAQPAGGKAAQAEAQVETGVQGRRPRSSGEEEEEVVESSAEDRAQAAEVEAALLRRRHEKDKRQELMGLVRQLEEIRMHALDLEHRNAAHFKNADWHYKESARNLLHYMALRNTDRSKLQAALGELGLSSLGRTEAHTMASIQATTKVLRAMLLEYPPSPPGSPPGSPRRTANHAASQLGGLASWMQPPAHLLAEGALPTMNFGAGDEMLHRNTENLLGPAPPGRKSYIMVTLPSEAAHDRGLVLQLMEAGMNVARINCAHDDERVWSRIIAHVRRASVQLGRPCRVLMDLAGPKLRTGPLEPGPRVARLRLEKDELGRPVAPACVWLSPPGGAGPPPGDRRAAAAVHLPVVAPAGWLDALKVGDAVHFTDATGRDRELKLVERVSNEPGPSFWAECRRGAYIQTGTALHATSSGGGAGAGPRDGDAEEGAKKARRRAKGDGGGGGGGAVVGQLAALERPLLLQKEDALVLTRDKVPGRNAVRDAKGRVVEPARVACEAEQVFGHVKVGEPIKLDDGKIEGVIESASSDAMTVRILHVPAKGAKLKAEKAINLPDSNLPLKGLTEKDLVDLEFITTHADMVAFSFVNDASDVAMLQEELKKRGAEALGVVLKIETKKAFEQLPWMLLQGMRCANPLGVMIARGDMAVECGWERLAEVQEEVLWLCEAAHVPTVWATQVLEGLAKSGLPSRAEITDAAMGERAECVMLNKGPHIVEAVELLDDILSRMRSHQTKKTPMLRPLGLTLPFTYVDIPQTP